MANTSIGQRIAAARKLRGLTQRGLADGVPCSLSMIRKVEQGDRAATPGFIAAVARALRVEVTELTGQPYRGRTAADDRVHELIHPLRREIGAYKVAPSDHDGPLPDLASARERVIQTNRLAHNMVVFKLAEQLPGVLYDLRVLVHALGDGGRREQAFGLLANAYENAMLLTYKLGYIDLSSLAVDRYEWAAAHSADPFMAAVGDYFRAGELITVAEFDTARDFLDRTIRTLGEPGVDPVALSVYGNLHLKSALAMARANKPDSAWDHLDEAAQAARRVKVDRDDYRLAFGPTNVKIWEVSIATELGDADAAITRSDDGKYEPPVGYPAERASHFHIDLARGYLWTGRAQDRQACLKHLLKAEKLAPAHTRYHPMTRDAVRQLVHLARKSPDNLIGLASRIGVHA